MKRDAHTATVSRAPNPTALPRKLPVELNCGIKPCAHRIPQSCQDWRHLWSSSCPTPPSCFIFLVIVQALPVQTHTSENKILMNAPQVSHRHGQSGRLSPEQWCNIGRAGSLLHFHEINPVTDILLLPLSVQLRSPSRNGRGDFGFFVSSALCLWYQVSD